MNKTEEILESDYSYNKWNLSDNKWILSDKWLDWFTMKRKWITFKILCTATNQIPNERILISDDDFLKYIQTDTQWKKSE